MNRKKDICEICETRYQCPLGYLINLYHDYIDGIDPTDTVYVSRDMAGLMFALDMRSLVNCGGDPAQVRFPATDRIIG
jgi:hypothetical protein